MHEKEGDQGCTLSRSAILGRISRVLEGNKALWVGWRDGWTSAVYLGRAGSRERLERANSHSSGKKMEILEECMRKREKLSHVLKSKSGEAVFSKSMWVVDVANFSWVKSIIQR